MARLSAFLLTRVLKTARLMNLGEIRLKTYFPRFPSSTRRLLKCTQADKWPHACVMAVIHMFSGLYLEILLKMHQRFVVFLNSQNNVMCGNLHSQALLVTNSRGNGIFCCYETIAMLSLSMLK